MELRLTPEQDAVREALHDLAEREVRPIAREAEEAGEVPEKVRGLLAEMGVLSAYSEDLGGQGRMDTLTSLLVAEELGWADAGVAYAALSLFQAGFFLDTLGRPDQRGVLKELPSWGGLGLALAELTVGLAGPPEATKVARDAGALTLHGRKYGATFAAEAPFVLVSALLDGSPGVFLLDAAIRQMPGFKARREEKLGLLAAISYRLDLEGLPLSAGDLLGEEGAPSEKVEAALGRGGLLACGVMLGLGRAALEYATAYAKERTAFGRPIGAFQAISFKIADRATELEGARLILWEAAGALEEGRAGWQRLSSDAAAHVCRATITTCDDAVQILGGHGYVQDHPVEKWYRDAMTLALLIAPENGEGERRPA